MLKGRTHPDIVGLYTHRRFLRRAQGKGSIGELRRRYWNRPFAGCILPQSLPMHTPCHCPKIIWRSRNARSTPPNR